MKIIDKKKRDIAISLSLLFSLSLIVLILLLLIDKPPRITLINPSSTFSNELVRVQGNHFKDQDDSNLYFNDEIIEAEYILTWSNSLIEFTVPSYFKSGTIFVKTPFGKSNAYFFTNKDVLPVLLPDRFYTKPVIDNEDGINVLPSNIIEISGGYFGDKQTNSSVVFKDKRGRKYNLEPSDYLFWSDSLVKVKVPPLRGSGYYFLVNPVGLSNRVEFELDDRLFYRGKMFSYTFSHTYSFKSKTQDKTRLITDCFLAYPRFPNKSYFYLVSSNINKTPYYSEDNYLDFYSYKKLRLNNNSLTKEFKANFYNIYVAKDFALNNPAKNNADLTNNFRRTLDTVLNRNLYSQTEKVFDFIEENNFEERLELAYNAYKYLSYDVKSISGLKISNGILYETSWLELDLSGIGQIVIDLELLKIEEAQDQDEEEFFSMSDLNSGYIPIMLHNASQRKYFTNEKIYNTAGVFKKSEKNVILLNDFDLDVQHFFINRTKPET